MLQLNQAHTPIQHLLIDLIFLSVSVPVCSQSDVVLHSSSSYYEGPSVAHDQPKGSIFVENYRFA